jgi:hypothetical protein
MHSKEHFHLEREIKVCLFDEAAKALRGSMATKWKCMQVLWNLGKEATMYTLFPSMFLRMGFGYTYVHWVFGYTHVHWVCKMVWGSFLWDWTHCVSSKVCTRLQTLQQKVQKYEANMEKNHTHNQNVSQIMKLFAQS